MSRGRASGPAARAAWPPRAAGGASRPRVIANVICACNSCTRPRSCSSSGPACAIASSRSAASGAPGLVLALGGEERTLRPAPRIGRQLDGALVKCRPRRQAAARPRSPGRALQLGGDVLVEPGCRLRAVPGAAIRIDVGIGGIGERAVHVPTVLRRASAVDRRTHERMTEAHLRAEFNQSHGGRRRGRVRPDAEPGGRPPHQHRIPCRLSRRDEKQESRRRRERRQPLPEALLDPRRHRRAAGQPQPACELGRRPATCQLKQRQRVAARRRHDPITTRLSSGPASTVPSSSCAPPSSSPSTASTGRPSRCRSPLGSRTAKTSPTDSAPRRRATKASACAEAASSHCASSTMQTSGRFFRDVRQQTQHRQADEEPIRRVAVAQTERSAKRTALRGGKALQAIQERCAQLLQPRVRELHLRLDADRPGNTAPGRVAAPDTPATRSCRPRPPRAAPAPGSDPRAHSPPADPAPHTLCAG